MYNTFIIQSFKKISKCAHTLLIYIKKQALMSYCAGAKLEAIFVLTQKSSALTMQYYFLQQEIKEKIRSIPDSIKLISDMLYYSTRTEQL